MLVHANAAEMNVLRFAEFSPNIMLVPPRMLGREAAK
jgi:hypothetical protein